jgi:ligand-binding sensor domain-containing protein
MLKRRSYFCWGKALSLILFITIGVWHSYALDPGKRITQYTLDKWNRTNGLPANSITQCIQTKDGFLWIGTSVGLFRFDGMNFEAIGTYPENENISESITSLCETRDSTLWIGTTYSGIRHFSKGSIKLYGSEIGFVEQGIRAIIESRDGTVWIGTGNGLFVVKNNKLITINLNPNYITALAEDHLGRIWAGTHEGIRIIESLEPLRITTLNEGNGLPHNVTTAVYCDSKGTMWIGTVNGLLEWNNGKRNIFTASNGLSDYEITSIVEDRNGNLWVGTMSGGLNRYASKQWSHLSVEDGITNNRILSIYEDKEGSLWFGTVEGLNRLKDGSVTTYTTKEGLQTDYISCIIEGRDRSLYFCSNTAGIIQRIKENKISIFQAFVGPVYCARDGSLWTGQTGVLTQLRNNQLIVYDARNGFPQKWISAITEDEKSLLLYIDDIGLHRFQNGRLTPYVANGGIPYFSSSYVTCLNFIEKDSTLWVGGTDGLTELRHGEARTYTSADGLAGNWVSSFAFDAEGTMWITSPRDGLTRYRNGIFTKYTADKGLFTNELYCAVCDNDNNVWLSSPRGIGYLRKEDADAFDSGKKSTLSMRVFTSVDGMKSEECFGGSWQPSGCKASDGTIWFATVKGAVHINPKALQYNSTPPEVHVVRIVADSASYNPINVIKLPAEADKIEISYTATSYLAPERVLFRYRLEGYDKEWINAKTRRVAYYTNLPPGKYRFRVIACNNDGVWNEEGASIEFYKETHFYQTAWFIIIVVIGLCGIIYGIYRWRVWQLKQREKYLQQRVQEELADVKMLSGLIPICSVCKRIRNDKGYWDQIEAYIQTHSDAKFSHGICPDCAAKMYPQYSIGKKSDESSS